MPNALYTWLSTPFRLTSLRMSDLSKYPAGVHYYSADYTIYSYGLYTLAMSSYRCVSSIPIRQDVPRPHGVVLGLITGARLQHIEEPFV